MSKLIVILGATGTQGSSVANTFLSLPGWNVRGVTRNPSSAAAQRYAARGVEMVRADLNNTASLVTAFEGAHAIFAVTDFWAPVSDPSAQEAAKAAGKVVNQYAYDIEVQQGKNIANAASDPSVLRTLEIFVYSSLSNAKKWSKGKYTWVFHFDSKAAVVEYIMLEKKELAERMSTLQVGEYADNWKKFAALAPQKQPDGTFLLSRPHSGKAKIPMVVTDRDTGAFVKGLVESPPGINLLGYGSLLGWEEYMQIWSSMLGVKAMFEQIPESDYLTELPSNLAREIGEGHAYQAEFGWDGGDPSVVHPKALNVQVPVTSIEEYIRGEDWSSIL